MAYPRLAKNILDIVSSLSEMSDVNTLECDVREQVHAYIIDEHNAESAQPVLLLEAASAVEPVRRSLSIGPLPHHPRPLMAPTHHHPSSPNPNQLATLMPIFTIDAQDRMQASSPWISCGQRRFHPLA